MFKLGTESKLNVRLWSIDLIIIILRKDLLFFKKPKHWFNLP